ncbi:carbohydrate-binding module family 13 protein [Rhizophagus irregularis DAOM 181602=DAOM 197198]|nr:carbohydrate-binding module family 13 protein [Rhizophagus irregularis DAOM 181602=DAOM 197198]
MILRYIYGGRLFLEEYDNRSETMITTKEISSKSIDSRIITFQHTELISKWIDRLENTDEMKNLYEFKLIFRGTRDGFSASKFHENKENVEENILSRVKDEKYAIYNYPNFGPVFGAGELNLFIRMFIGKSNRGSVREPIYYESIREIALFSVEEFEVFQIMKD